MRRTGRTPIDVNAARRQNSALEASSPLYTEGMYYRHSDTDHYGDGDVPEADDKPYQDNDFEPHPQTDGEN